MEKKVTKEMLISEVLDINDDIMENFLKHGLNCLGCPASYTESITEAAKGHGADVNKLVEDINLFIEKNTQL